MSAQGPPPSSWLLAASPLVYRLVSRLTSWLASWVRDPSSFHLNRLFPFIRLCPLKFRCTSQRTTCFSLRLVYCTRLLCQCRVVSVTSRWIRTFSVGQDAKLCRKSASTGFGLFRRNPNFCNLRTLKLRSLILLFAHFSQDQLSTTNFAAISWVDCPFLLPELPGSYYYTTTHSYNCEPESICGTHGIFTANLHLG